MGNTRQSELPKELRQRETEVEKKLWFRLRNRQIDGAKFRRQQRVGNYVVDFISFEKKLIIEIDGGQHNEVIIKENDKQRTLWLEGEGYQVIRFWSNDIMQNTDGVLESITAFLEENSHPHLASPLKGEE